MYALLNKFNIYFQNKKFNIFGKTKLPKNSTGNPVLKYARHARAGAGLLHGAVFSGLISYPGTMVLILCSCRSSRVLKFPIIWFFRLYENSIQKPPYKSWIFNAIWVNCHHRFWKYLRKIKYFPSRGFYYLWNFSSKVTRLASNSNTFWTVAALRVVLNISPSPMYIRI